MVWGPPSCSHMQGRAWHLPCWGGGVPASKSRLDPCTGPQGLGEPLVPWGKHVLPVASAVPREPREPACSARTPASSGPQPRGPGPQVAPHARRNASESLDRVQTPLIAGHGSHAVTNSRAPLDPAWRGSWTKQGGLWSDSRRDCQEGAISPGSLQTSVRGMASARCSFPGSLWQRGHTDFLLKHTATSLISLGVFYPKE